MAGEVRKTLHHANRHLYGTHYSRKKSVSLATYAVQERTFDQGLHTHILVGVPEGSLNLKAHPPSVTVPDLIKNTWLELDPTHRRFAAQDAQKIYHLDGVVSYVHKTIRRLDDIDALDVINTTYSKFPATVPLERDNR